MTSHSLEDLRDADEEQVASDQAENELTQLILGLLLQSSSDAPLAVVAAAIPSDVLISVVRRAAVPAAIAATTIMVRRSPRLMAEIESIRESAERAARTAAANIGTAIRREADRRLLKPSDPYQRDVEGPTDAESWARSVAHTAVTSVVESTKEDFAQQLGFTHARWQTRMDDRVRDSHAIMEGEIQPIGEPFRSGLGNLLTRPGDPSAPLSDTINCRCRLRYLRQV